MQMFRKNILKPEELTVKFNKIITVKRNGNRIILENSSVVFIFVVVCIGFRAQIRETAPKGMSLKFL